MDTDPDPIPTPDLAPNDSTLHLGVESRWQDLVADLYIMSESDSPINVQVLPVQAMPSAPLERLKWLTQHGYLVYETDSGFDEEPWQVDDSDEPSTTGFILYPAHEFTDTVWKPYDDQTDLFAAVVDTIEAELDQVVYFSMGRLNLLTGVFGTCRDKPGIGVLLTARVTWT